MRALCLAAKCLMLAIGFPTVGIGSATQDSSHTAPVDAIQEILSSKELRANALLEKLDCRVTINDDLGFGARFLRGYGMGILNMVVVDTPSGEWVVDLRLNNDKSSFEWRDEARWSALIEGMRKELEAPPQVDMSAVPEVLQQAAQSLVSPYCSVRSQFGEHYGATGTWPCAKLHIHAIVAAQRWDLVREILRGLNPVGRVYAAQALIESGQATPSDTRAIRILYSMKTPIRTCGGCMVERSTMANLLPGLLSRTRR